MVRTVIPGSHGRIYGRPKPPPFIAGTMGCACFSLAAGFHPRQRMMFSIRVIQGPLSLVTCELDTWMSDI
jgi:hypothetical protein